MSYFNIQGCQVADFNRPPLSTLGGYYTSITKLTLGVVWAGAQPTLETQNLLPASLTPQPLTRPSPPPPPLSRTNEVTDCSSAMGTPLSEDGRPHTPRQKPQESGIEEGGGQGGAKKKKKTCTLVVVILTHV